MKDKVDMLTHALEYARAGFTVLPCQADGKKPLNRHGCSEATTEEKQIKSWWGKWPQANIGIATGAASNLVVIDVDDKDGRPGKKSLEKLLAAGELTTATIRTPSNGVHLYFRPPGNGKKIINRADVLPGVDVRGDGGYVVAPPSVIKGKSYTVVDPTVEIALIPAWLLEIISSKTANNKVSDPSVSKGARNQTLTSLAGTMRRRGMSLESILAALRQENITRCTPPLPDKELTQIAESVMRYDPADDDDLIIKLTDMGNAERFITDHGSDVKHVQEFNCFIVWRNSHWEKDHGPALSGMIKETVSSMYAEALKEQNEKKRKKLLSWSIQSASAGKMKAMADLVKNDQRISIKQTQLDSDPWLLGIANGVIDLRSGHVCEPRRDDLVTASARVEFNPAASCPTFEKFLDRIFDGNAPVIEFVQRAIGYSITGATSEQCLFFAYGSGANGKSTLMSVIGELLGDYSRSVHAEMMIDRPQGTQTNDLARLRGARFVSTMEVEEGKRMAESLVKQMTGNDRITARFLYGEFFEYKPSFKLWLAANHKPIIRGTDFAIWRRIRLVPFNVTIPKKEQDPDLGKKLEAELPGILKWAIDGCLDWQRQGLNPPRDVLSVTAEYRSEMDVVGAWIEECCQTGEKFNAKASDLYNNYRRWCENNGEWTMPQSRFKFKLTERGLNQKRSATGMIWEGIGLTTNRYEEMGL